jgi:hypothetical protein
MVTRSRQEAHKAPLTCPQARVLVNYIDLDQIAFYSEGSSINRLLTPLPYGRATTPISVLRINADPPDKSAFNRGYFYRMVLTELQEQTYLRQMHIDIHAEAAPPKRSYLL